MTSPIRLAHHAEVAGARVLHLVPGAEYAAAPPELTAFRPVDPARARNFLRLLARPAVPCPAEAVMLYRDAIVLDGKQVLAEDGTGVLESFGLAPMDAAQAAWQARHLARIARREIGELAPGLPVVAIFGECAFNYGHMLVEMLPRLVHLSDMGLRQMRLLLPDEAAPLRPMVEFALAALGLEAVFVPCPPEAALRVRELHWVSPVARHEARKSPTLLRLMARLRAAAPAPGTQKLLYVARPAGARRQVANAAEVEAAAQAAGFAVVEPSVLDFPGQLALFAGARRILGPLGAALTSQAAMPAGGEVGMLDDAACDPFFWDLACLCGHRFRWGFTAPVGQYDPAMLERPMTVPTALLAEMLAA